MVSETDFEQAIARKKAEALGVEIEDDPGAAAPEDDSSEDTGQPAETADEPAPAPDGESAPEAAAEETDDEGRTVEQATAEALEDLPADATAAEREQAQADAVEQFYVRNYKTREEAEAGYAEKDRTLAESLRDRAELRRQVEELEAMVTEEPASGQEPLDTREWQQWAEETVEQGGGKDQALLALQEGGWPGYEIFMRSWLASEEPQQRAEAILFSNQMAIEIGAARAEASFAPERERIAKDIELEERVSAQREAARRRPDLGEYEDEMQALVDELDDGTKAWLRDQVTGGGLEGKVRAIDYLYLEAKSRRNGSRSEAQRVADARSTTSGAAARTRATVASAQAAPPRTPRRTEAQEREVQLRNAHREQWGLPLIEDE